MGNIETTQRKPIFHKIEQSRLPPHPTYLPFRKRYHAPEELKSVVRNKYTREYSPLTERKEKSFQVVEERGRQTSRVTTNREHSSLAKSSIWTQDRSRIGTSAIKERPVYTSRLKQSNNTSLYEENRMKCQQIMKKVRNFNQFLIQLKRKMKQTQQNVSKPPRQTLSLTLKLQNEKLELEKYKKLVQRELSKQHSIETINIQHQENGSKVLQIQYEIDREKNLSQKFEEVKSKVNELGSIINRKENGQGRIDKITKLMNRLQTMQEQQLQYRRQVQKILREKEQRYSSDED